jgi:hypothetical protein
MSPLEKAKSQQQDEDELGKTRVVHRACLQVQGRAETNARQ